MNPGESYDPLLMSLVKSTSISLDQVLPNWGKCHWGMVVGARLPGLCEKLQRCWVFHAQQFPVCIKNGPPPKGHQGNLTQLWEALESTWASIPVECFPLLVESVPLIN